MLGVVIVYLFDYFSPSSITHKLGFGAWRGRHLVVDERCTVQLKSKQVVFVTPGAWFDRSARGR